jgi:hypothetical protein
VNRRDQKQIERDQKRERILELNQERNKNSISEGFESHLYSDEYGSLQKR